VLVFMGDACGACSFFELLKTLRFH